MATYIGNSITTPNLSYLQTSTEKDFTTLLNGYLGMPDNEATRASISDTIISYVRDKCLTTNTVDGISLRLGETNEDLYMRPNLTTGNTYVLSNLNSAIVTNDYALLYVTINGEYTGDPVYSWVVSERESKRRKLRMNLVPVVKCRNVDTMVSSKEKPEELMAMEALREVVTEAEFRKYLKYGFVLVKGRSGATYQVYRNRSHVKVWVDGKVVEEICVYLKGLENGKAAPATDKVIAFKTMIEADEEEFKKLGNRYRMAA